MSKSWNEARQDLAEAMDRLRDALLEPFEPFARKLADWLKEESDV